MDRVTVDQAIMGGVPCIAGTRIPVVTILGLLGDDIPITEVLALYPQLTRDDVLACLRYAAEAAGVAGERERGCGSIST